MNAKPNVASERASVAETHKGGRPPRVLVFMEAREFGGPAKNLAATSRLLSGEVDFKVVTFIRGNAPSTEFTEKLTANDVAVEVIRERFRYDPRGLTEIRRIVKSYGPDIVQIHNSKSRMYLYVLRKTGQLGKVKTIDCYHGETWTDTKQLAYNKLDRWLFRRAKNIIVVSQRQVRLLEEFGVSRDRITVIYNGIRLVPSSPRTPNSPLRVVTIGRLSREKGHSDLLEAVKQTLESGVDNFVLVVVGDGPERANLEAQAQREGISDVVEFTGYQPDPTPFYENADLFVLPSLTEGIPNVLLEAAIHHVPIVSTTVGGVPEMFDDETEALLVPPANVETLSRAIARCVSASELRLRLAESARKRVERQFTDDHRAHEYSKYYDALIDESA